MLQINDLHTPFCYRLKELSTFLFVIQNFGIKKVKHSKQKAKTIRSTRINT